MNAKKPDPGKINTSNDFYANVYDVVRLIPKGRATSYGAIAAYLGSKRSARMVGWAMGNSLDQEGLPAHRVVNKAGVLTGKLQFDTPEYMQEQLESEGIIIENDQIQNWKECFWDPEKEL